MPGPTHAQDDDDLWQQGSLLPTSVTPPALFWAHTVAQASKPARSAVKVAERRVGGPPLDGFVEARRPVKPGERAVVVSQTCDILKPADTMPQVEVARVFETDNRAVIVEAENIGSSRYFRLDDGDAKRAVVLDYTWRSLIDKGLLDAHAPDNRHVRSSWRQQALARWLGRRYARPVLDDRDVATVSDPIRERWRRLVVDDPEAAAAYSAEFAEFRFRREANGRLVVFVLSPEAAPDPLLALEVVSVLAEALEPHHAGVTFSEVFSYYDFTKADELDSEQIDLEWASHDEGVAIGALSAE